MTMPFSRIHPAHPAVPAAAPSAPAAVPPPAAPRTVPMPAAALSPAALSPSASPALAVQTPSAFVAGGVLFGAAEPREAGAGRWGVALAVAICVQAAAALAFAVAGGPASRAAVPPEPEPLVVFFTAAPQPAAPSAAPLAAPARARRAARPRPLTPPRAVPEQAAPALTPPAPPTQEEVHASETEEALSELPVVAGLPIGAPGTGAAGAAAPSGLGVSGPVDAVPVGQVARAPDVREMVRARYPVEAKKAGVAGRVVVRIIIGTDGRVEAEHTRVVRSVPALDAAAVAAVNRWRFTPALARDGRPARVIVDVPVEFSLR
jgi:protein TonB